MKIGVLGDFNAALPSHLATNAALAHAARSMGIDASVHWLPTPSITVEVLEQYDGLFASPGSPYRSMAGMLAGIRFARTRLWPFVAT